MSEHINVPQPSASSTVVANQRAWEQTNNEAFYSCLPGSLRSFYQNWVKPALQWYDGFVPEIHGGAYGLLSTCIGTTLVNRMADSVFGGDIMFSNARKPVQVAEIDGKTVGKALDYISNHWVKEADAKSVMKRGIRYALAGGFSLLKLNMASGRLWVDAVRADRFYVDFAGTDIRRCVCLLSLLTHETKHGNPEQWMLVEDRYYERIGLTTEIPVVEYKIYSSSSDVRFMDMDERCVPWENIPKDVRAAFKKNYGDCRLNEPKALNLDCLGVYLLRASDGISNLPQIGLGESVLSNIFTYLYEYDFYNSAFNTDMYLARGRVLVPKAMQSPLAGDGAQPKGLDEFMMTEVKTGPNGEPMKPTPIQFEMRSEAWKSARNILLESMATGVGFSVSTIASYLNDGSNRTAREVSAEESATALTVESMRRLFEEPINRMIATVLRFAGLVDDVEIRWTKAGMSNQTVLVDTLSRAVQSGLISRKKAHSAFNFDDDEEQNNADYELVLQEEQSRNQAESQRMWDFGDLQEGMNG